MITNGSLLTEKNVTLLKDLPLDFIQISMDGVKEVQDSRRFFHSGKGSFDFVMKGIDRLLSKTSIHISIQVAVDKQNIDSYENLLEYMNTHYPKEMDEKRIEVSYNVIGDRTNFDNGKICFNHAERFKYIKHINQRLTRQSPWQGLTKHQRYSIEKERNVPYPTQLASKSLQLGIERFCRCVGSA